MTVTGPGREVLWGELLRELRRFVRVFDEQPEWLWEAETQRLIRAVRPRLALLDDAGRTRQDGLAARRRAVAADALNTHEKEGVT